MSILNNDLDIKFRLGNYYTIVPHVNIAANTNTLLDVIGNVELGDDFKIHTKWIRAAIRNAFGKKYLVKRIAMADSWKFECYLPEDQKPAKSLWSVPSRLEFYINREIHLYNGNT